MGKQVRDHSFASPGRAATETASATCRSSFSSPSMEPAALRKEEKLFLKLKQNLGFSISYPCSKNLEKLTVFNLQKALPENHFKSS